MKQNLPKQFINKKLISYIYKDNRHMNPNQHQDYNSSPKEEIDLSKLTESEREAQFRRKRQEYINEKINRKKIMMKMKKEQFGSSSSDSSDQSVPGSKSSGSSGIKQIPKPKQQENVQVTPKKLEVESKSIDSKVSPTKKKSQTLQKFSINVPSKKGNEWTKDVLVIGDKIIIVQNLTQQIKRFSKLKIMFQNVSGGTYKIKITLGQQQQIIFAIMPNEQRFGLPCYYFIFAKLIESRLLEANVKLAQSKLQKIPGIPQSLISKALIYGKILKKSQVLGNWQERLIVVNKQGIYSYKKYNQKHSMFIPSGSVNQMWTRFQIHDNFLVVKIGYGSSKTQFGFPLTDYISTTNWLYNFYLMIGKGK